MLTERYLMPGQVSLSQLEDIYWNQSAIKLDRSCRPVVANAASCIANAALGNRPVYGVNTGFGKLASMKIEPGDTAQLQKNLILSHCCGVGDALAPEIVRLMMALKLLSFGRGASGVRWELIELLEGMLEKGVVPVIP